MRRLAQKISLVRRLYYRLRMQSAGGQLDVCQILDWLTAGIPKTFVELGFHPYKAWRPNALREKYSDVAHQEQWTCIKDLPFETV